MSINNYVPRMLISSQKGGSRRRKGGNPDWLWGCMSGGALKKRRTRKSKSLKKRTRRHYR